MENLLNPDSHRGPWLSCPQDKSGQLKVELQLERAVPIGYIDVGEWISRASGPSEGETPGGVTTLTAPSSVSVHSG